MRISTFLIPVALAAAMTAGCSASAKPAVATANAAPAKAAATTAGSTAGSTAAFGKCMRANGVDMPDPKDSQTLIAQGSGVNPDSPVFKKAMTACTQYLPNGGQPPAQDPAVTAQMLKFAKCMRDHGVAMPDPSANGSSMIQQGSGIDPTDPKFKAAQTACQSLLPNGMVQGGQVHAGQGAGNP